MTTHIVEGIPIEIIFEDKRFISAMMYPTTTKEDITNRIQLSNFKKTVSLEGTIILTLIATINNKIISKLFLECGGYTVIEYMSRLLYSNYLIPNRINKLEYQIIRATVDGEEITNDYIHMFSKQIPSIFVLDSRNINSKITYEKEYPLLGFLNGDHFTIFDKVKPVRRLKYDKTRKDVALL